MIMMPAGGANPLAPRPGPQIVSPSMKCEPPIEDVGGGWERCENGMLHRANHGACESRLPRSEPSADHYGSPIPADAGPGWPCRYDADCTEQPLGHCELGIQIEGTYCDYGCATDADCAPGYVCLCGDLVGACTPASCAIDSDCGSGLLCGTHTPYPGCPGIAVACQTPNDDCGGDLDCPEGTLCSYNVYEGGSQRRTCEYPGCQVGRPFLVDEQPRLAAACSRADWRRAGRSPAHWDVGDEAVADALRDAVARGWTDQALMEHASVAAFARFSLQLLSLGAPADLVQDAARAMHDEIEHARGCFELASRHSGTEVGPGPLALEGALDATGMTAIVLGTIAEGCVGETVASLEAAEAAELCEDADTRALLVRIAADEMRHAELAWRFVAWSLAQGDSALRREAQRAFELALASAGPPAPCAALQPSTFDLALARHGLLSPALRGPLRRRVLGEIIEPCARALFARANANPNGIGRSRLIDGDRLQACPSVA